MQPWISGWPQRYPPCRPKNTRTTRVKPLNNGGTGDHAIWISWLNLVNDISVLVIKNGSKVVSCDSPKQFLMRSHTHTLATTNILLFTVDSSRPTKGYGKKYSSSPPYYSPHTHHEYIGNKHWFSKWNHSYIPSIEKPYSISTQHHLHTLSSREWYLMVDALPGGVS